MFRDQRVLAIVPARGGSKGLPRKNLQCLAGVSLVALAARVASRVSFIDRAAISTDDSEIAETAIAAGLSFNGFRPTHLSGDFVADCPVLQHELLAAESADRATYDIVLMLQPTCPLREVKHVVTAVQTLVDGGFDSVWTVSRSDPKFHPRKQLVVDDSGCFDYFDPSGSEVIARQQLSPLFYRNGAAYAITRDCLMRQSSIKGARAGAAVIEEPMVSIDTAADLRLCEFYLADRSSSEVVR